MKCVINRSLSCSIPAHYLASARTKQKGLNHFLMDAEQNKENKPSRALTSAPTLLPARTIISSPRTPYRTASRQQILKNPEENFALLLEQSAPLPPLRTVLPQRVLETGKLQPNWSPARRLSCCRGRGRPGSKHGTQQEPIQ